MDLQTCGKQSCCCRPYAKIRPTIQKVKHLRGQMLSIFLKKGLATRIEKRSTFLRKSSKNGGPDPSQTPPRGQNESRNPKIGASGVCNESAPNFFCQVRVPEPFRGFPEPILEAPGRPKGPPRGCIREAKSMKKTTKNVIPFEILAF